MFGLPDWILLISTLLVLFICYVWRVNQFFKNRGLNFLQPQLIFGNMAGIFLGNKSTSDVITEIHSKFPNDRYVGMFYLMRPVIIVKDLDLIKSVLVKDFEHFMNHEEFTDDEVDPLLSRGVFSMKGETWREMRATLSPAFTGLKMRGMLPFILHCAQNTIEHLKKQTDLNKDYAEFEMKEFTSRFSNDVIASCAFGIKLDSLSEKKNTFFMLAKTLTNFTLASIIKLYTYAFFPSIIKLFRMQMLDRKTTSYFKNIVLDNMKTREKEKIIRHDMIHLLMLAQKGMLEHDGPKNKSTTPEATKISSEKTPWSDDDIVAQALSFIFAGFDTVSSALAFFLYELAMNPDVQKRLYEEIESQLKETDGKIDYEDIAKYKYLDMVLSETLRLWPPGLIIDRICIKPFLLPPQNDENGVRYKMEKDENLFISIYSVHRDPQNFKNPDAFDPERFSDENKDSIKPFSYMPFGGGPRICIGSRLALMEIKLYAILVLSNFEVVPTPNTPKTIVIQPNIFDVISINNLFVGFKKRKSPA